MNQLRFLHSQQKKQSYLRVPDVLYSFHVEIFWYYHYCRGLRSSLEIHLLRLNLLSGYGLINCLTIQCLCLCQSLTSSYPLQQYYFYWYFSLRDLLLLQTQQMMTQHSSLRLQHQAHFIILSLTFSAPILKIPFHILLISHPISFILSSCL